MTDEPTAARLDEALHPIARLAIRDDGVVTLSRIVAPLPPNDADAIAAAIVAMDPWHRYGFPRERLRGFLSPADESAPRYLMTVGAEPVGLMALKLGWMFGSYLNILAVLPAWQGRGIGSAALQFIEAEARRRGERNQFVVTSAFNAAGLQLYTRHGFAPIAEMPGLIDDSETEILMRKRLV